jgi:hypothetical protein
MAAVNASFDEIASRGLGEWATFGRTVPIQEGEVAGFLGYTLFMGKTAETMKPTIFLSERWLNLSLSEQGEILLEETWHAKTASSCTQELVDLLEKYREGGPGGEG